MGWTLGAASARTSAGRPGELDGGDEQQEGPDHGDAEAPERAARRSSQIDSKWLTAAADGGRELAVTSPSTGRV